MDIRIKTGPEKAGAKQAPAPLALFIFKKDIKKLHPSLEPHGESLSRLFRENLFKGEKKSSLFVPFPLSPEGQKSLPSLILVGAGEEKDFSYERARRAAASAVRGLEARSRKTAELSLESLFRGSVSDYGMLARAAAEGALMAGYECMDFKKPPEKPEEKKIKLASLAVSCPKKFQKQAQKGLEEGRILGEAVNFARKLANYPGNLMTPSLLAKYAQKEAQNSRVKVTVWDKKRIQKEKMGGLLGVSLGSSEEPRFIIMEYKGAGPSKKPVCLVGKGLTFDSGGISIKPGLGMEEMKFDMCGGAAVIAAMLAIEKLKLKVNVLGLVPSSENMPGPAANKPGDILKARNEKPWRF